MSAAFKHDSGDVLKRKHLQEQIPLNWDSAERDVLTCELPLLATLGQHKGLDGSWIFTCAFHFIQWHMNTQKASYCFPKILEKEFAWYSFRNDHTGFKFHVFKLFCLWLLYTSSIDRKSSLVPEQTQEGSSEQLEFQNGKKNKSYQMKQSVSCLSGASCLTV